MIDLRAIPFDKAMDALTEVVNDACRPNAAIGSSKTGFQSGGRYGKIVTTTRYEVQHSPDQQEAILLFLDTYLSWIGSDLKPEYIYMTSKNYACKKYHRCQKVSLPIVLLSTLAFFGLPLVFSVELAYIPLSLIGVVICMYYWANSGGSSADRRRWKKTANAEISEVIDTLEAILGHKLGLK